MKRQTLGIALLAAAALIVPEYAPVERWHDAQRLATVPTTTTGEVAVVVGATGQRRLVAPAVPPCGMWQAEHAPCEPEGLWWAVPWTPESAGPEANASAATRAARSK